MGVVIERKSKRQRQPTFFTLVHILHSYSAHNQPPTPHHKLLSIFQQIPIDPPNSNFFLSIFYL